jgi:hypothetical protein
MRQIAAVGDRAGGRAPVLRLLREAKVRDLLADVTDGADRFEASGVLAGGDRFWVVFDNVPHIARLDPGLVPGRDRNALLRQPAGPVGYEDIAHDPDGDRFFALVEAVEHRPGSYLAQVHEFDRDFRQLSSRWLDFPLDSPNKGLEGLSCVRRGGQTYLLGLCEGNRCRGGAAGRRAGGGRVHVFAEAVDRWERLHTIRLPPSLPFADYSSASIAGDRIAVVSQESSALWTGRFAPSTWDLVDDGVTYGFPRDLRGRTVYGTVEGVSWVTADEVVVVSDRAKPTQPGRFRDKDQSVHVFALGGGGPDNGRPW